MGVDLVTVTATLQDDLSPGLAKASDQMAAFRGEVDATSGSVGTMGAAVDDSTEKLEGVGEEASKSTGFLSTLGAGFTGLTGRVKDTGVALAAAGEDLSKFSEAHLGSLLEYAKKPLEYLGLGEAGIVAAGVEQAKALSTAKAAITQAAGGGPASTSLFDMVKGLEGPFNLSSLTSATTTLLGSGQSAKQTAAQMKELGNVTALNADPNSALTNLASTLGKVESMNEVSTKSLTAFGAEGIDVYGMLAKQLNTTRIGVTQMVDANLISGQQFANAFAAGESTLSKFDDGLTKSRQTLSGMFTQLKVTVEDSAATMMTPLTDSLEKSLPKLTTTLGTLITGLAPAIASLVGGLGTAFAGLLPAVTPLIEGVTRGAGELFKAMGPTFKELGGDIKPFSAALENLLTSLAPVIPIIAKFGVSMLPIVTEGVKIAAVIAKVIVPAFGGMLDVVDELLGHLGPFKDVFAAAIAVMLTAAEIKKVSSMVMDFGNIFVKSYGEIHKAIGIYKLDMEEEEAGQQHLTQTTGQTTIAENAQANASLKDAVGANKATIAETAQVKITKEERTAAYGAATAEDAEGASGDVEAAGSAAGSTGLLASMGLTAKGGIAGKVTGVAEDGAATGGIAALAGGAAALAPAAAIVATPMLAEYAVNRLNKQPSISKSEMSKLESQASTLKQEVTLEESYIKANPLPGQTAANTAAEAKQVVSTAGRTGNTNAPIHFSGNVTINVPGSSAAEVEKAFGKSMKTYVAKRMARGR